MVLVPLVLLIVVRVLMLMACGAYGGVLIRYADDCNDVGRMASPM